MFTIGKANVFFTELATIRGTVPLCGRCAKPISKSLAQAIPYSPTLTSFWFMRCPDCLAPHIVFNATGELPPPREFTVAP